LPLLPPSNPQVALNKFDELYNKVKGGGTLLGKSFKDLFNEWKVHYPKVSNESLPQYIECSINRIGNYPYKFFVDERGNPKVDTILQSFIVPSISRITSGSTGFFL